MSNENVPVLDDVHVFAIIGSIAHSQHTMIQFGLRADKWFVDTTIIELYDKEGKFIVN